MARNNAAEEAKNSFNVGQRVMRQVNPSDASRGILMGTVVAVRRSEAGNPLHDVKWDTKPNIDTGYMYAGLKAAGITV